MDSNAYARFLPAGYRQHAELPPEPRWWPWREHTVHIAQARRPGSAVRLLVVHGAGGHSGALWPIAAQFAARDLDVTAVDLPLYGRTVCPKPQSVRYEQWVELLVDFLREHDDGRPVVLLGASIGGLLAYEVSSRAPQAAAVAATCLLDPAGWRQRAHMTRFGTFGALGGPLSALARGRVSDAMVPMSAVANLAKMSRNPQLSRLCAKDPRGGAARVPLGFLASYMRFKHSPPEQNDTPVTLLHPSADAWTPVELSVGILARAAGRSELAMLRECGHFPIEEPGFGDLIDGVVKISVKVAGRATR